jgi:hypothetical protein
MVTLLSARAGAAAIAAEKRQMVVLCRMNVSVAFFYFISTVVGAP